VQPLHFGPARSQLFGLYHEPLARGHSDTGVLLCYPAVQEYNRTHFAFRKLAGLLIRQGFHVLRFDYFGTGDSAGESGAGSAERWIEDIRVAAGELRDLGGVDRISLVGLRLGAALGTLAACDGLELQDLVLWEPVTDGASHLRELEAIQAARETLLPSPSRFGPDELLDYPLPPPLRASIAGIELRAGLPVAAERVLLFAARSHPALLELQGRLRGRGGAAPELRLVPDETAAGSEGILLSTQILRAIAAGLAGEGA